MMLLLYRNANGGAADIVEEEFAMTNRLLDGGMFIQVLCATFEWFVHNIIGLIACAATKSYELTIN